MGNPLLGQILGSVFASAMRGRTNSGPFGRSTLGGLPGGGLGGILGGMAGRRGLGGNRGMLLAMLLPFALQWVQRNGGIGAVLDRFRQRGYGNHADSWVGTGQNQPLAVDAVDNVVGRAELSRLAAQLGVPEEEVAQGFAEILPEMTDQLSPDGRIPPEADDALEGGLAELQRSLADYESRAT